MLAVLETLPGLSRLVQEELNIKNVEHRVVYREDSCLYIDVNPHDISKLRSLQTVNYVEIELFDVDYVRDTKTLRKLLREKFREVKELIKENSLVTFRFYEVSKRIQKIILREAERVFKCRLVKARGDYVLSARFLFRKIRIFLDIGTFQPLYRRWYTRYKSRASLNPILAASLCVLAGSHKIVIDPFAGSYTIPIEYCRMWRPEKFTCLDISFQYLSKGLHNLQSVNSGVYSRIEILCCDFFLFTPREKYECIVTDPPRGIRLEVSREFYNRMFRKFAEICTDECIIVMPMFGRYIKFIEECARDNGFDVVDKVCTVQGGYRTFLVKFVRLPR